MSSSPPSRLTLLRSTRARMAVGLYLLLLSVYLLTSSGHFYSTDHVQVYQTAESLAERQNLAIGPVGSAVEHDGKYYATYEPGQAVLSLPFYAVGAAVDGAASPQLRSILSGDDLGVWGGTVQIFFVSLFNHFVAPAAAVLVFLICIRFGWPDKAAFLTALAYGLGTMAFVGAHEYFQHPLETFWLLACIYVLIGQRRGIDLKHGFLAGMLLAAGMLSRISLLAAVPPIVAYVLWLRLAPHLDAAPAQMREKLQLAGKGFLQNWREEARFLAAFLAPFVLAAAATMYLNYVRSGSLLDTHGASTGNFSFPRLPEGLYGYTFSLGRSFFLYSPLAIAGALMFRRFYREHAAETLLFGGIAALYLGLYCSFEFWHGAGCWGPRYLEPLVPLAVIPAAYMLERTWSARFFAVLAAAGCFVALLGIVVNPVYAEQWRGLWGGGVTQPFQGNAYFYVPAISPPVIHFQDFFAGRNWDLWLQFVYNNHGALPFIAGLLAPTCVLVLGLRVLSDAGFLNLRPPSALRSFLESQRQSIELDP